MKHKTPFYLQLSCPRAVLLFKESSKKPKYILTDNNFNSKSKTIFKKEKPKIKESIFNLIRNTKKNQIRRENKMVINNKNRINNYISILNDAHIDEGIVINQYFSYLKKNDIEYEKSQQLKMKQMIIPIKYQEKLIKDKKKSIKFFKSISNHMIMKYMFENKDKLNQYMNEIYSYKSRNSLSLNYNKRRFSTNQSVLSTRTNYKQNVLKTYSNYDDNLKYIDTINNQSKDTISNLKLKIRGSISLKPKDSLSINFLKQEKIKNKRKSSVYTIRGDDKELDIQYFTPLIKKKNMKYYTENNKNNNKGKVTSRSGYKTLKYKFTND